MKVLCIDTPLFLNTKQIPAGALLPIEGEIYTVVREGRWLGLRMYILQEFLPSAFEASLFIPVSEIDETELVNHQLQTD